MNVIDAIRDENLFRPFFGTELRTWRPWLSALRAVYGIGPLSSYDRQIIAQCTGRDPSKFPTDGFSTALFLTGRRSGKSRVSAVIGAFEAVLGGHEVKLSKGEKGVVPIIAPTREQAGVVHSYLRAVFRVPLLEAEVVSETKSGFELRNGVWITVLTGDWRTVRSFTLLAAIVDEVCFFGLTEESKVRSDTELIRALKPGLATIGGRLVAISSPYAKKGWAYSQWKMNFKNDNGKTLVWNCPSRTMNPTLPQSVVDEAMAEDRQAALSEYGGEWRDDVALYVPRDAVERLVIPGRAELMPRSSIKYFAFCDLSGGRGDDATLAIAHKDERKVVVDFLARWRPPFNPQKVCEEMATELRRWNLRLVTGDNYSAEYTASAFRSCGINYVRCEKPKSELYRELLPRLFSDELELLDNGLLVDQLASLERRTRSGGKDIVDHPQGGHDDLANAVAGVCDVTARRRIKLGAF